MNQFYHLWMCKQCFRENAYLTSQILKINNENIKCLIHFHNNKLNSFCILHINHQTHIRKIMICLHLCSNCAKSTQFKVYILNIIVIKYLSKSCLQSIRKTKTLQPWPEGLGKPCQSLEPKLTDEVFKFCCHFTNTRQVHNRHYGRIAGCIRLNDSCSQLPFWVNWRYSLYNFSWAS